MLSYSQCVADKPQKSSAWDWQYTGGEYAPPDPEPNVVSPVAKRVLKTVRRTIPLGTTRGPAFDDPEKCPFEVHQYQIWLAARLKSSGLAAWLAGGPAFLPDVADELRWPWNVLARAFAPRSYEQLARKVAGNLEWYLDQSRPVRDPWKIAASLVPTTVWLTLFTFSLVFFTTGLRSADWVTATGVGLALFALIYTILMQYNRNTHFHATNTAELYRYLAETYSEPEHPDSPSAEREWNELIQRLPRLNAAAH